MRRLAPLLGVLPMLAAGAVWAQVGGDSGSEIRTVLRPEMPGSARHLVPIGVERVDSPSVPEALDTGRRVWALGRTDATPGRLVFLERRDGGAWHAHRPPEGTSDLLPIGQKVGDAPYTMDGAPQHAAEMTADGHGAFLGARISFPDEVFLLTRRPGEAFEVAPAPGSKLASDERLGWQRDGRARALIATVGGAPVTAATFVVPTTESGTATGVLRLGEDGWTREQVEAPAGTSIKALALAASGPGRAWLLAQAEGGPEDVVTLLRRVTNGDAPPVWRPVDFPGDKLLDPAARPPGLSTVAARPQPADPLAVTDDGLWVDLEADGRDVTVHMDAPENAEPVVDGRWCDDASLCDHPLGIELPATGRGYESIATPAGEGHPFGGRIISSPIDADTQLSAPRRSAERQGGYAELGVERFFFQDGIGEDGTSTTQAIATGEGLVVTGGTLVLGVARQERVSDEPPAAGLGQGDRIIDVARLPGQGSEVLALTISGSLLRQFSDRGFVSVFARGPQRGPSQIPGQARALGWAPDGRVVIAYAGGAIQVLATAPSDSNSYELIGDDPTGRSPATRPVTTTTPTPTGAAAQAGPRFELPASPEPGSRVTTGDSYVDYIGDEEAPTDVACSPRVSSKSQCLVVGINGLLRRVSGDNLIAERLPGPASSVDITSAAWAGSVPIVATARGVFAKQPDGSWRLDDQLAELATDARDTPAISLIAATTDGGLVADGRWKREPGGGWTKLDVPIDLNLTALAAYRDGDGVLRAMAAVTRSEVPVPVPFDPDAPRIAAVPFERPDDAVLLRETSDGWIDLERTAMQRSGTADLPVRPGGIGALAVDDTGSGLAVGGTGPRFDADLGSDSEPPTIDAETIPEIPRGSALWLQRAERAEPPTAVPRASADTGEGTPAKTQSGWVRIAIGGRPLCLDRCEGAGGQRVAADVVLGEAAERIRVLADRFAAPDAVIVGGGRAPVGGPGLTPAGARRYRRLADAFPVPTIVAPSAGDLAGTGGSAFKDAFGDVQPTANVRPVAEPAPPQPAPGKPATMYAFDVISGDGAGALRVMMIDNASGRLATGPSGRSQFEWIEQLTRASRIAGIPVLAVGTAPLDDAGGAVRAEDWSDEADLLEESGVVAYVATGGVDDPADAAFGGNLAAATLQIPNRSTPARLRVFQSSSLSYAQSYWGLLKSFTDDNVELEGSKGIATSSPITRNTIHGLLFLDIPVTQGPNAGVEASVEPLISRASFSAEVTRTIPMGRAESLTATGDAPALDEFLVGETLNTAISFGGIPTNFCAGDCNGLAVNARFTSDDPAVGTFVRASQSSLLATPKVVLTGDGTPLEDPSSPVFCPKGPGTTTVTVQTGGRTARMLVEVVGPAGSPMAQPAQAGRRPAAKVSDVCAFPVSSGPVREPVPEAQPEPAPVPEPATPQPQPPPIAEPAPLPVVKPASPAKTPLVPVPPLGFVPAAAVPQIGWAQPAPIAPVKPPGGQSPVPPGGNAVQPAPVQVQAPASAQALQSAVQVGERRERAFEHGDAASAYVPADRVPSWAMTGVPLLLIAATGGWLRGRSRRRTEPALARGGVRR